MTPPPSPEFLLLAACCRWPRAPEAVRAPAATAIDWPRFLRLVRRHRVSGLAHGAIVEARIAMPDTQAGTLAAMALEQGRASLACAADTARIAGELEATGVEPVFFKGATLALLAYGDLAIKQSSDIDILVRPDEARATLDYFAAQGFEWFHPAKPSGSRRFATMLAVLKSATLIHRDTRKVLDVHWRLATNAALLKPVRSFDAMKLAGRSVATLKRGDLAMYLATHGAGHGWMRLKWLADFNALLNAMPPDEIATVRARAHAERIDSCVEAGLALCEHWFGGVVEAAPAVPSSRGRGIVAMADNLMRGPDETAEQNTRIAQGMVQRTAGTFLKKRGFRFQAINLWYASFKREDALIVPLPRALLPLYVVIGPSMRIGRNLGRLARLASRRAGSKAAQPHQP